MLHLLPWPHGHEDMRFHHIPALSMDNTCWRLGVEMDRGKSDTADLLRHAVLSSGYERSAVLYH